MCINQYLFLTFYTFPAILKRRPAICSCYQCFAAFYKHSIPSVAILCINCSAWQLYESSINNLDCTEVGKASEWKTPIYHSTLSQWWDFMSTIYQSQQGIKYQVRALFTKRQLFCMGRSPSVETYRDLTNSNNVYFFK